MTPTGLEQPWENTGEIDFLVSVPPPVPPSQAIELISAWAHADDNQRAELLALARSFGAGNKKAGSLSATAETQRVKASGLRGDV